MTKQLNWTELKGDTIIFLFSSFPCYSVSLNVECLVSTGSPILYFKDVYLFSCGIFSIMFSDQYFSNNLDKCWKDEEEQNYGYLDS